MASTTRSRVPGPMRPVATPSPARTRPSRERRVLERADDRRADGDDAPAGGARRVDRAPAVDAGIRYGSSSGSRASSAASPVDEMPAACVSVASAAPRSRSRCTVAQSSTKPADGGSNATGRLASRVHVDHIASGCGTCAYWIGRPCRAMPLQTSASAPSKASSIRRGWPSTRSTTATSGPSRSRSPACSGGGSGRCSVGVR